jgi:hypothetical protein
MGGSEVVDRVRRRPAFLALAAVWLVLVAGQAARLAATGSLMSGDGVYHFAHLHSLVVDRDLDAVNEIRHFQQAARSPYTGRPKIGAYPTRHPVTGEAINKYPLGVALLTLPAYAAVYAGAHAVAALGVPADTTGYGPAYQWAGGLLVAAWAAWGLWCCVRVAADAGVAESDAWWAAVLTAGATPWLFYATLEPYFSHALSAAAAATLWLAWLRARDGDDSVGWGVVGLAGGVAALIRYQDATLLLIPLLDLATRPSRGWRARVRSAVAVGAGALVAFTPQLVANTLVFGDPLVTGYAGEGFLYLQSPWLIFSLLSAEAGLFRWAPIAAVAVAGLVCGAWWGWPQARWGLALLAMQLYLVSSWYFYSQGHTFGNRMLVNCTVVLAVGLAAVLTALRPRPAMRRAALISCCVLVGLNIVAMVLWSAGRIGPLAAHS